MNANTHVLEQTQYNCWCAQAGVLRGRSCMVLREEILKHDCSSYVIGSTKLLCTYHVSHVMKYSCYGKHQLLYSHLIFKTHVYTQGKQKKAFSVHFAYKDKKMVTKDNICIYTHVPIMHAINTLCSPANQPSDAHMHNNYKSQ